MTSGHFWRRSDVVGAIGAGVAYGVVAQLVVRLDWFSGLYGVMSFGYVFVLPALLGFITAFNLDPSRKLWASLGACCATSALCLGIAFAVGWEGSICLIMAAPVYFTLALLGGLIGYYSRARKASSSTSQRLAVALLLSSPLLSAAVERELPDSAQTRHVTSTLRIAATPETVWRHIARVPPITEPQNSLFFSMGFPRPIEATLSHEGVGGVRNARFERGLYFLETVTLWDPPRSIRFAIEPDPKQTPLTTLDEHVLVGGRYFDVLEGDYRIEPLDRQTVLLHLTSEHKISTHFNAYTSLWSDYLMAEIQRNILLVIKQRAEQDNDGAQAARGQ